MRALPPGYNAGDMVYCYFPTYGSSGESITITGLAVTDIEIYKNGGTTQRASDNGYTLLDTDGIDIDGSTGLHGFKIDTSDNSDAGFWADGSHYLIWVDAVTVNGQTVRLGFELLLGYLLRPTTAGRKLDVSGGGEAGVDWANVGSPTTTLNLSGTTVKTATDVEADTQDIQSRLPAALTGSGYMKADVVSLGNEAAVVTYNGAANWYQFFDSNGDPSSTGVADLFPGIGVAAKLDTTLEDDGAGGWRLTTAAALRVWAVAARTLTAIDEDATTIDLDATIRAAIATELARIDVATSTRMATYTQPTGFLAATFPASPAAVGSAMTLTAGERTSVADALLDRADGVESGVTPRQYFQRTGAVLAGTNSGAGTGTEKYNAVGNPGTLRATYTIDASGNRSVVTFS